MDIRSGGAEGTALCAVTRGPTGGGFIIGTGTMAVRHFVWNGSNWALSSASGPLPNGRDQLRSARDRGGVAIFDPNKQPREDRLPLWYAWSKGAIAPSLGSS